MDFSVLAQWINILVIVVSVLYIRQQILNTSEWNKKKCTDDGITSLVMGSFNQSLKELTVNFSWNIPNDPRTYVEVIEGLNDEEKAKLDIILVEVLRNLEVLCIKIKHDVVDEELCFDYFCSILTNIATKCDGFIKQERVQRGEEKVMENVTYYSYRWSEWIKKERQDRLNVGVAPKKKKNRSLFRKKRKRARRA